MGEITQDGFSFDSDWIDARVAKFTDRNAPSAWRRMKLEREIAAHDSAMHVLLKDWPHDLQAQAHAKASPRSSVCSLSSTFNITLPSNTMANSSEMDGLACFPVIPPGLMLIMKAWNCDVPESEPREAISACDQSSAICTRSPERTIFTTCLFTDRKNSASVTSSAFAIFSIEEMEGEHCPFSICDMKLGVKSVRAARARIVTRFCCRRKRRDFPRVCSLILGSAPDAMPKRAQRCECPYPKRKGVHAPKTVWT
jgi:hypothetical protein